MARTFGGVSTDKIVTNLTAHNVQRSYGVWTYRTGNGGGAAGFIWAKQTAGALVNQFQFFSPNYRFIRAWTSLATWEIAAPAVNEWHHFVITYDGSSTTNDPVIYMDGVSQTVNEITAPSGTLATNADAYVIGNRATDNARNWAGRLAQFVVYDRILNANEVKGLCLFGPLAVPGWVRWLPVFGLASPEPEWTGTGATTATVTGTVQANHPPMRPFTRGERGTFFDIPLVAQTLSAALAQATVTALAAGLTPAAVSLLADTAIAALTALTAALAPGPVTLVALQAEAAASALAVALATGSVTVTLSPAQATVLGLPADLTEMVVPDFILLVGRILMGDNLVGEIL